MKNGKNYVFRGLGTALVTPFAKGEIDFDALYRLIDMQIAAGADAVIIGGTTGEAATLAESERDKLYSKCCEYAAGRTKIIAGTGTNDTAAAVRYTSMARRAGCDGALVVTPYYNKGTEEGIYRHYITVADSSDIPIILYNVPGRTGVNLGIRLLERLGAHPLICGIKEASDSVDRLTELSVFRDTLPLYAGNDSQIYPVLALGGAGVISVVSNLKAELVKRMCQSATTGEWERALEIQHRLLPLIKALFTETNPSPVKYAMSILGLCSSEVRLPLAEPRDSTKAILDEILKGE